MESFSIHCSKGGVIALTRVMAVDYAKYGIRVNCICPGYIETDRIKNRMKTHPQIAENFRPFHLLGFGSPEDIAYAALYLASGESRILTGAVIPIDSGFTIVGRIDSDKDVVKS